MKLDNDNYNVDAYGGERDMEKAIEQQAQLIGRYEAMEKAQREWEEKFRENNNSTPVCYTITYLSHMLFICYFKPSCCLVVHLWLWEVGQDVVFGYPLFDWNFQGFVFSSGIIAKKICQDLECRYVFFHLVLY